MPEEYLADERFAAILAEAEKYIGYPYVWGGYSPSTSFDCSGFVSWVINHSGWAVGRLGATGLYNICTPGIRPRPGDLVFFVGTYDTAGCLPTVASMWATDHAPLWRPHPIFQPEQQLLAGSFLRLRAFTMIGGFTWRQAKARKIQAEMEKVKAKISEAQAKLKELEQKHREAENEEIVDIVRGMSVPLDELPLLLQKLGALLARVARSPALQGEGRRNEKARFLAAALGQVKQILLSAFVSTPHKKRAGGLPPPPPQQG